MKWMNRFLNIILGILLMGMTFIVVLSSFSSPEGQGLLGYKGYSVATGSMEPTFSAGSFIIVEMAEYETIEPKDIVTFQTADGTIVTHRVTTKELDGLKTKGDANNVGDKEVVPKEQYIGRVKKIIPYLGAILLYLQNPMIILLLGGILVVWLLVSYYFSGETKPADTGSQ